MGDRPDQLVRWTSKDVAVFAAFWQCCDGRCGGIAEFKPCGAHGQLDVSCYGRQKWQDDGKNGHDRGKVMDDSGKEWRRDEELGERTRRWRSHTVAVGRHGRCSHGA